MLELLHDRQTIQEEARQKLRDKFHEFDIECVDVLIGKPDPREDDTKIETLLEQLRLRQLSSEQVETFEQQRIAADKRRVLYEAEALAAMQTQVTNARVQVEVAQSNGEAELALARKKAEQTVVFADADLARSRRQAEQTVMLAEAEAKRDELTGHGQAKQIAQVGLAEASVLHKHIASYGDPRLYALSIVAEHLAHSSQPLVPERMFLAAGSNGHETEAGHQLSAGLLGTLINLLVAEKLEFQFGQENVDHRDLETYAEKIAAEVETERREKDKS
jgi:hypothetical protein